jgi:RNA polymerase subunit RPABC4/transcription elongation factor Spt4
MTDCEKCADAFASGAKFCPECGNAAKGCSKCGLTLSHGVKFCPDCGTSTIGAKPIASSYFGSERAEGARDTAAPATGKSREYAPPIDLHSSAFEAEVKDPTIKRLIVAIILGLVIIGVIIGGILLFAFRVSDTATATPAQRSQAESAPPEIQAKETGEDAEDSNQTYTAIISCGMSGFENINVLGCFTESHGIETELELKNGNEYGLYKVYQINSLGRTTDRGLEIKLHNHFQIKAQNASEHLILGLRIINEKDGSQVFAKQVSQYGAILVSN